MYLLTSNNPNTFTGNSITWPKIENQTILYITSFYFLSAIFRAIARLSTDRFLIPDLGLRSVLVQEIRVFKHRQVPKLKQSDTFTGNFIRRPKIEYGGILTQWLLSTEHTPPIDTWIRSRFIFTQATRLLYKH